MAPIIFENVSPEIDLKIVEIDNYSQHVMHSTCQSLRPARSTLDTARATKNLVQIFFWVQQIGLKFSEIVKKRDNTLVSE